MVTLTHNALHHLEEMAPDVAVFVVNARAHRRVVVQRRAHVWPHRRRDRPVRASRPSFDGVARRRSGAARGETFPERTQRPAMHPLTACRVSEAEALPAAVFRALHDRGARHVAPARIRRVPRSGAPRADGSAEGRRRCTGPAGSAGIADRPIDQSRCRIGGNRRAGRAASIEFARGRHRPGAARPGRHTRGLGSCAQPCGHPSTAINGAVDVAAPARTRGGVSSSARLA